MKNERKNTLEFLEKVKKITGLSYSKIATDAGLANTTLTRYISNEMAPDLSHGTRNKVSKLAGFESYENYVESGKDKKFIDEDIFILVQMQADVLCKKYDVSLKPKQYAKFISQLYHMVAMNKKETKRVSLDKEKAVWLLSKFINE